MIEILKNILIPEALHCEREGLKLVLLKSISRIISSAALPCSANWLFPAVVKRNWKFVGPNAHSIIIRETVATVLLCI